MRTTPIAASSEQARAASPPPPKPIPGAREVAARKTVTSTADIRAALARAHQAATGEAAPAPLLDMLTAHVSHETALGTRMFNYNFGGIKGKSPAGDTARYMTREVTPAGEEVHISAPFRAYSSLDQGAADYVDVMRSRFPEAFAQASTGDPAAFAAALKRRGYYTASETSYAAAMRRLVNDPGAIGTTEGPSLSAARAATPLLDIHPAHPGLSPLPTAEQLQGPAAAAQQLLGTTALARVMDSLSSLSARQDDSRDLADS